ncbi:hypothetical protein CLF_107409 [Clonorchis sinensis]|uniref:Uncharacterized protein n=1 Tax=Clonorchis sinensis TaxID=79923 RepID=G7YGR4_CLOSI|nr:hypothetical protein CLF_107409 [Clonorchis sinensis]
MEKELELMKSRNEMPLAELEMNANVDSVVDVQVDTQVKRNHTGDMNYVSTIEQILRMLSRDARWNWVRLADTMDNLGERIAFFDPCNFVSQEALWYDHNKLRTPSSSNPATSGYKVWRQVHHVSMKDDDITAHLRELYEGDFHDLKASSICQSVEDKEALRIVEESSVFKDGQYKRSKPNGHPTNQISYQKNRIEDETPLVNVTAHASEPTGLYLLREKYSDWSKLLRSVVWLTRFKTYLRIMASGSNGSPLNTRGLKLSEVRQAERDVIHMAQKAVYMDMMKLECSGRVGERTAHNHNLLSDLTLAHQQPCTSAAEFHQDCKQGAFDKPYCKPGSQMVETDKTDRAWLSPDRIKYLAASIICECTSRSYKFLVAFHPSDLVAFSRDESLMWRKVDQRIGAINYAHKPNLTANEERNTHNFICLNSPGFTELIPLLRIPKLPTSAISGLDALFAVIHPTWCRVHTKERNGFGQFVQKHLRPLLLFEDKNDVCTFHIDEVFVKYLKTKVQKTIFLFRVRDVDTAVIVPRLMTGMNNRAPSMDPRISLRVLICDDSLAHHNYNNNPKHLTQDFHVRGCPRTQWSRGQLGPGGSHRCRIADVFNGKVTAHPPDKGPAAITFAMCNTPKAPRSTMVSGYCATKDSRKIKVLIRVIITQRREKLLVANMVNVTSKYDNFKFFPSLGKVITRLVVAATAAFVNKRDPGNLCISRLTLLPQTHKEFLVGSPHTNCARSRNTSFTTIVLCRHRMALCVDNAQRVHTETV